MTWTAGSGRQSRFLISCRLVGLESGALHASHGFGILHEGVPDKSSARVLRHQEGDSGIDGNDVVVVPVLQGIECVDKSVSAPGVRITGPNIAEDAHHRLRKKWQRPAC